MSKLDELEQLANASNEYEVKYFASGHARTVLKLIAIARQAENLLAHLPSNTIPDNTKHSAELLQQAISELKDG